MNNWRATERIAALVSQVERLEGKLAERTAERDRARATAVALENQLAEVEDAVGQLAIEYERRDTEEFSGESVAALDAAQRYVDAVDAATDPLVRDMAFSPPPVEAGA